MVLDLQMQLYLVSMHPYFLKEGEGTLISPHKTSMSTTQPRIVVHLDKCKVSNLEFPHTSLLISPLLHLLIGLL